VNALLEAASAHGAELRSGVEALRLVRSNGRITGLDTTAGRMRTGAVVVAAGVWTRELAAEVGAFVPLEAAKGYHVEVEGSPPPVSRPVYMEEVRVIATPLGKRLRLAGTLELLGLDMRVDPIRVDALARAARRVLRVPADARAVQVWRGLRPCTPDGLPLIGRSDGCDNLYLATGHAMLGITLAPATGEIVASLVTGEQSQYQIEPFSPSRFRRLRDMLGGRGPARREGH
jgi:D-amino-acid dehydrogenase